MKHAKAIYRALLHGFPAPFRQEYGDQMSLMFGEQLKEARRQGARWNEAALWMRAVGDVLTIAPREHWYVVAQDLRYACRAMSARPGFASVAILSLALGIGANTAIFSLWNRVLHASLPMVADPERLVMFTSPGLTGMLRGDWNGRANGPRPWVSYAEFQDLRGHASAFEAVMASQSSPSVWDARVDGGAPEEIHGRLVSGGFFLVLGVRPALGRLFTTALDEGDDGGETAVAVISDAYWQRRFGGRADVIGRTLTVHGASITVIGVAPQGFVGESAGQRPDVWLPLRLQPRVLPGSDWLREQPPDKVMWLHVFGRLKPGVTHAQAEAQANIVFRANLDAFYAATSADRRSELVEQRLTLRSGARGASATLDQFSSSLTMLLGAVGILMLITCANLANLLLARSAARQGEMAVRMSLGASRGRLIRQLLTESLALAALGGLAAMAVSYGLHRVLVRMLQDAEPKFFVEFSFSLPVLAFAVGATFACAIAIALLPARQLTAKKGVGTNSRGAIGSRRELRSGRWLVGVQLALSLPLLVGAGLLVRTVYNLQHPDLGFRVERLLIAQVGLGELMRDIPRRDRVLRELAARLEQIPAVDAATFSQLGLLSGAMSNAPIEVEGSARTRERPQDVYLDRVGSGYFTTLGIPIRMGRDITDRDGADSPKVCVVNDAFVDRFFDGRNPIGRRITAFGNDGSPTSVEVVGVAADAHAHDWRIAVEPRFFVPAEQRLSLGSSRTFLIRTRSEPAAVVPAVREAVTGIDEAMSVAEITSMDDQIAALTAEDRAIAGLAGVFGAVAVALAAIGLYGVLSFGVTRRSRELAVRIALGARPRGVIGLILGESLATVVGGLAVGCGLAYLGSRLIATRLYDVAPQDPLTFLSALGVLLVVALVAAWLPARRASKVDPMTVLRQA